MKWRVGRRQPRLFPGGFSLAVQVTAHCALRTAAQSHCLLHVGDDCRDVLVGDLRKREPTHHVDEAMERLVVSDDLLQRPGAMVVEVRGGLVDTAQLRNVESVEDLVAAHFLEGVRIREDGAGVARPRGG